MSSHSSSAPLRDIPERTGYDRILLGLEDGEGNGFTLERSTGGGQFRCYEGLHYEVPEGLAPTVLKAKHNPTQEDNVSTFLLSKVGMAGKRILKNARGETNNLSFRNLTHLCVVSEGDIQKQGSPVETGQYVSRTAERSTFKLLLTGLDDSAVEPDDETKGQGQARAAKIEVIDELLSDTRERITALVGEEDDPAELDDQIKRLNVSLERENALLRQSEGSHREIALRRTTLRGRLEAATSRRREINELLTRFALLEQHYASDLSRLEGLREAGALVGALGPQPCPLCGAAPSAQHLDGDCDGNIEAVVRATDAESAKIRVLRNELRTAVEQLQSEAARFDELAPRIQGELSDVEQELAALNPAVTEKRVIFSELLEKHSTVETALSLIRSAVELEGRKTELDQPKTTDPAGEIPSELSTSTLDAFARLYEQILINWHFPDAFRVYFDRERYDFVISGKPRGSRGKGMRAITHAAFTIALLEFTRENELPHPGFAILDTPLLAYREPEGDEDDLRGTDVHEQFYNYLLSHGERQVIIIENSDPPEAVRDRQQSTFFGKNPHKGRYGFFPI